MNVGVESLVGTILKSVVVINGEEIIFTTTGGDIFKMHHGQNCCESVYIEDISGDLRELIGSPLLIAEEEVSENKPIENTSVDNQKNKTSYTWTFYKFATVHGYVDIRWFGESNGYYSEGVSLYRI